MINGLRSAIGFLTILPLAPSRANGSMASARGWFPLVGLLIGVVLAVVDALWFGVFHGKRMAGGVIVLVPATLFGSAFILLTLVALTRALHLDGFMDSCDALLGGFTRERRLAILRDPHVGAFAVIGVVCLLLIKFAAISELPLGPRLTLLMLFPCLSRWAMLLTMELYPYIRSNGLGTAFFDGRQRRVRWQPILGFAFTLAVSVLLAGIGGIVLLAAACAVAWGIGAWAARLLGGVTGDIYGAVNEVSEAVVLVFILLISATEPNALDSPLFKMLWSVLS